jgi:hypothetical protein
MDSPEDKKPASRKRRKKDSHIKSHTAKQQADIFIEAFSTDHGHGAITRSALKAYPNQNRRSAAATGNRLLKEPYIQAELEKRRQLAASQANVTRNHIIGNLVATIFTSLNDILTDEGRIDWETAQERNIAHLIQEVDTTERHSKDGSSRTTTKYKLPSKLHAMDLLSDLMGWKKLPATNPQSVARSVFQQMRSDPKYHDVPDEDLARLVGQAIDMSQDEVLAAIR